MARETSSTPVAARPVAGTERPSLNESLDELARLSDQLIDQLTDSPVPTASAASPSGNATLPAGPLAAGRSAGNDPFDLDAIFSDLEVGATDTDVSPAGLTASSGTGPAAAKTADLQQGPHHIQEVLKHLEELPKANGANPWESLEPTVAPVESGTVTALPAPASASTERGRWTYWLIAAALAIAAGLGGAVLVQGPRTAKPPQPKRSVSAPTAAPIRAPQPQPRAPKPEVAETSQPEAAATDAPRVAPIAPAQPSHAPAKASAAAPPKVRAAATLLAPPRPSPVPASSTSATPQAIAKTPLAETATTPIAAPKLDAAAEIPRANPEPEPPPANPASQETGRPAAAAVENPQVEYKLLEAPAAEAARPAGPTLPVYQPPHVISRAEPAYPAEARAGNESGTIVMRLLISEAGVVERGVIESGIAGSSLEAAAVNAAMSWTYEPARQSGRPVRAWITERVVFKP